MRVVAHRGLWPDAGPPNSVASLAAAAVAGHGIELDVRDRAGTLVISHDTPLDDAPPFADLLATGALTSAAVVAINIKADGLQALLAHALAEASFDWFLFDASVPDLVACVRRGLRCFTRQSEHEPEPSLYDAAAGVWIDGFDGDWVEESTVLRHLDAGKQVCIVSPELHRRPSEDVWHRWSSWSVWQSDDVMLCTDRPALALEALA